MKVALRPASDADRSFVESVYFDTHRWLIEKLFGRRGEEIERQNFAASYDQVNTSIVLVDGSIAGWLTVVRRFDAVTLKQIYLSASWQNQGIGTRLIGRLIDEARGAHVPLRLSTAKINPARSLYERLGFRSVRETEHKVYMELT